MTKLILCGPNLNGADSGMYHVHDENCADLKRYGRGKPKGGEVDPCGYEYASVQAVVESVYEGHMSDSGDPWTYYRSEFRFFPCIGKLPEVNP